MIHVKMNSKTRKVLLGVEGKRLAERGIKKALYETGVMLSKEVSKGIKNPPKTGRYYRYKGGIHQASAPGEYPANRSGKLRRSRSFKVQGARKMTIGLSAEYAKYLEEGTQKIAKRKLLGFTIRKHRNKIRDIIRKNVNSEFK